MFLPGMVGILLTVRPVHAEDHNIQGTRDITFHGRIAAGTCNVTKPETVELGKYYKGDFSVAGGNTGNVPVTISFDNCDSEISQATVIFTGTPYSEDTLYSSVIYANQVAGGATDVGLQLFDYPNIHVALANGVSYPVSIENGTGAMKFIARMYTPHGSPTAGKFSSAVTLNVTYN